MSPKQPKPPKPDPELARLTQENMELRAELAKVIQNANAKVAESGKDAGELRIRYEQQASELEELRSFRDYAQRSFMILETLSRKAGEHRKYFPDLTHMIKR